MDPSSRTSTEVMPESDVALHEEPNANPAESKEVWHDVHPTTIHSTPASAPEPDALPEADQRSISIYWSLRSISASTLSLFNLSSGRPSQDGATWEQAIHLTNNSGFGPSGTPRSMGNNGVREGRERGGFLPRLRGVGRTGKEPYAVPRGMLKALGVVKEGPSLVDREQPITYLFELEAGLRRDFTRLAPWAAEQGSDDKLVPVQAQLDIVEASYEYIERLDQRNLTPLQFEVLDKCYGDMLSLRAQLKTLDEKLNTRARMEWEEGTLYRGDMDRLTRGWFRDHNTRRYEPEYLENLVRKDYEVRRPRRLAEDYGLVIAEPYGGLHKESDSHSHAGSDSQFENCLSTSES